jgi:hypothetical protein
VHSCPEAESRESPRERERKNQRQEMRERTRKLKMREVLPVGTMLQLQGVRARLRTLGSRVAVMNPQL